VRGRVQQLRNIGHTVDKVEFIVIGGTFLSLDKDYKLRFVVHIHTCVDDPLTFFVLFLFLEIHSIKTISFAIFTTPCPDITAKALKNRSLIPKMPTPNASVRFVDRSRRGQRRRKTSPSFAPFLVSQSFAHYYPPPLLLVDHIKHFTRRQALRSKPVRTIV
jgi:hypothetical protein